MVPPIPWRERSFRFDLPIGMFPAVWARLAGMAARAADLVAGQPDAALAARPGGKWSALDHLGHLAELATLDEIRLEEFLAGVSPLSAADPENRATWAAAYDRLTAEEVIARLRAGRRRLVARLAPLAAEDLARTAVHPRLRQPMRLLDWAWFVAEHDDHHLAHAALLLGAAGPGAAFQA